MLVKNILYTVYSMNILYKVYCIYPVIYTVVLLTIACAQCNIHNALWETLTAQCIVSYFTLTWRTPCIVDYMEVGRDFRHNPGFWILMVLVLYKLKHFLEIGSALSKGGLIPSLLIIPRVLRKIWKLSTKPTSWIGDNLDIQQVIMTCDKTNHQ